MSAFAGESKPVLLATLNTAAETAALKPAGTMLGCFIGDNDEGLSQAKDGGRAPPPQEVSKNALTEQCSSTQNPMLSTSETSSESSSETKHTDAADGSVDMYGSDDTSCPTTRTPLATPGMAVARAPQLHVYEESRSIFVSQICITIAGCLFMMVWCIDIFAPAAASAAATNSSWAFHSCVPSGEVYVLNCSRVVNPWCSVGSASNWMDPVVGLLFTGITCCIGASLYNNVDGETLRNLAKSKDPVVACLALVGHACIMIVRISAGTVPHRFVAYALMWLQAIMYVFTTDAIIVLRPWFRATMVLMAIGLCGTQLASLFLGAQQDVCLLAGGPSILRSANHMDNSVFITVLTSCMGGIFRMCMDRSRVYMAFVSMRTPRYLIARKFFVGDLCRNASHASKQLSIIHGRAIVRETKIRMTMRDGTKADIPAPSMVDFGTVSV